MTSETTIYVVNSANVLLEVITIISCFYIIWKYIFKPGMHKKCINMFYVVALLVLISSFLTSIALFSHVPNNFKPDDEYDITSFTLQPGFFTISNSIHSTCYIGLIVL